MSFAHQGSCHCGALEVRYESARAPADTPVRACQCSFCRRHGARAISDPAGQATISSRVPEALGRYRFGLGTADFLVCTRCGVYVAAVFEADGRLYATLNLNALDDASSFTQPAEPFSYEGETSETRRARRAARWTPATVCT